MTKLIFVDVGSHEAQEFQALFLHGRRQYFHHWVKHLNRIRRAGGEACNRACYKTLLSDADFLKAHRSDVAYILVEPNARLCALETYRAADLTCNFALAAEPKVAALNRLFYSSQDRMGQGSSLFVEKPNVDTADFDWVLTIDPHRFAKEIAKAYSGDDKTTKIILRINNEGAEDDVIKAFHTVFGDRLVAVMGSLSDVEKVKGAEALDGLYRYIADAGIPFIPLHSDFATWPKAIAFVRSQLA
ncbi:hypothetical protein [Rhodalgimonas zhirmunskyi]|uniref:Uncharacterized protein n=1 Tax=Rhodalgimonas zhirmunskyi TaxID=2964767 RepID=A0AAJ1X4I2_9RHOB|nr:hypothetical protein [Rhodoalgimonas zhirmunskyi]MDQ2094283.1 hypothetical protein [Rhodoalgimonas zhirmunskyi]